MFVFRAAALRGGRLRLAHGFMPRPKATRFPLLSIPLHFRMLSMAQPIAAQFPSSGVSECAVRAFGWRKCRRKCRGCLQRRLRGVAPQVSGARRLAGQWRYVPMFI